MKHTLVLALVLFVGSVQAEVELNLPKTAPQKPKITVSKETTFLTKPLAKDGAIDYVAALNKHLSKDVTPDNNSAIPLIQALGPEVISEKFRSSVLKALGLTSLPKEGSYFLTESEYADQIEDFKKASAVEKAIGISLHKSDESILQAKDHPELVDWLQANRKPLDAIIEATKKERFYVPQCSNMNPPQLFDGFLSVQHSRIRQAGKALRARAMIRISEGDFDAGRKDLLGLQRLGSRIAQNPLLIEQLVAVSIRRLGTRATCIIAASETLTAEQASLLLADMDTSSAIPHLAESIGMGERFYVLDYLTMLGRYGLDEGTRCMTWNKEHLALKLPEVDLDWNQILRDYNIHTDEILIALRQPTYTKRIESFARLEKNNKELLGTLPIQVSGLVNDQREDLKALLDKMNDAPRKKLTKAVSILLIQSSPVITRFSVLLDRQDAQNDLAKIALGLAGYRADNEKYPQTLKALTPKYLKKIPLDLFADQPFRYRRQGKGYLLYSVGENQKNDGGAGEDEKDAQLMIEAK